jgi:hypothetical protein
MVSPDQMMPELLALWRLRSDRDPLDGAAARRALVDHAGYFVLREGRPTGAGSVTRPDLAGYTGRHPGTAVWDVGDDVASDRGILRAIPPGA